MASVNSINQADALQVSRIIRRLIKMRNIPALIWGGFGIGKSQLVRQIGAELGYGVVEFRLGQVGPTDLMGIPYVNKQNNGGNVVELVQHLKDLGFGSIAEAEAAFDNDGIDDSTKNMLKDVYKDFIGKQLEAKLSTTRMAWGAPSMLPVGGESNEDKVILFLDEVNTAPQLVQAAAYQLVLDRRVGPHELGKNVYVIACANPDGTGGATHKMATPLLNRFMQIWMRVSVEAFLQHAQTPAFHKKENRSAHPLIQGWCRQGGKENIERLADSKSKENDTVHLTPRTLEYVSNILYEFGDMLSPNGVKMMTDVEFDNEDELKLMVGGCIGFDKALALIGFAKNYKMMPHPDKIIKGEITSLTSGIDPDIIYSLSMNVAQRLYELHQQIPEKEKEAGSGPLQDAFHKFYQNGMLFFLNNSRTEIASSFFHLLNAGSKMGIKINTGKWDKAAYKLMFEKLGQYIIPPEGQNQNSDVKIGNIVPTLEKK